MASVVFVLFWTAVLAGLGAPICLLIPTRISGRHLAAPVFGLALFGTATTLLYQAGIPLRFTGYGASFLGLGSLAWAVARWRRELLGQDAPTTVAAFGGVILMALAPMWIGGEQFTAFQSNPWDHINYIASASSYGGVSFAGLAAGRPEIALANDYNQYAAGMLHARPTVAFTFAAMRPAFFASGAEGAYAYLVLLQALTFFAFAFVLRSVVRTTLPVALALAAAFSLGTYVQLVFDINAWSHLAALSLLTLTAGTIALGFELDDPYRAPFVVTLTATGQLYFYPEMTPALALFAAAAAAAAYAVSDRRWFLDRFGPLAGAAGATLLLCLPFWRGTLGMIAEQGGTAFSSLPNDWFPDYFMYLVTRDARLGDFIRGTLTDPYAVLYLVLSMPIDFSMGVLGLYFLRPDAGTARWLAVLGKLAAYGALIWLVVSIATAMASQWRSKHRATIVLVCGMVATLALPALFFALGQRWTGGKTLLMIAPFLFFLICLPLLCRALKWRYQVLSLIVVIAHASFGVQRLSAASAADGLFRPPPYPITRELKRSHRWDIAKRKVELGMCRHIAINVVDPHMSRYVQTFLTDVSLPWHSTRPLNSYFGTGITLGLQPQVAHDCLITDVDATGNEVKVFDVRAAR